MTAGNSVVARVAEGWARLDALVDALGPEGLRVTSEDGWAVKDHLVHIASWEISLLALLQGTGRAAAMGVPGLAETEAINAAVWNANKHLTPEQAIARFRDAHARLMAALEALSDEDLNLAYNHYQPEDPKPMPEGDRPVSDWVNGNTFEHYAEHVEWINQLIEASPAR